jgi:hypothetical protein
MGARLTNARVLRRVFRDALLACAPLAACATNPGCGGAAEGNGGEGGTTDSASGGMEANLGSQGTEGGDGGGGIGDADSGGIGDADSGEVSVFVDAADACMSCFCGLPTVTPSPWRIPYPCANPDASTDAEIHDGGADAASAACLADAATLASPCLYPQSGGACPCRDLGCPLYHPYSTGGSVVQSCAITTDDAGAPVLECVYSAPPCGRRPSRFRAKRPWTATDPLAAYLASSALLEAISVDAFEILAAELQAHGAPHRLVRAASRAAREEVRHARETMALARRFGAKPGVPSVSRHPVRSIEAIALENAAEGCVRETYGALLATHQAHAAADPEVRATMAGIALDETRHAALAWDIADWAGARLDDRARRRVECARVQAIRDLRVELAREPHAAVARVLGVPRAAAALAMVDALRSSVWRAAA